MLAAVAGALLLVVAVVVVIAAIAPERNERAGASSVGTPPTRTAEPSAASSATPSPGGGAPGFDIAESGDRVAGYPSDWREITASDGSFRAVVPPPVYVHELPSGGWELEIAGAPTMYLHGRDIGARVSRRVGSALALRQLERWVRRGREGDRGDPIPVMSAGSEPIDGWEVRVELDRRIETYRTFAVRGWLVGLWTSSAKNDPAAARLGRAFLSSFEALRRPGPDGTVLSA